MLPKSTCSIDGCERPIEARGWCNTHYTRWRKHGSTAPRGAAVIRGTPEERFWPRVHKTDGCWLWTASLTKAGYAQFSVENRPMLGHRVAYEWLVGPIPDETEIDHLCRVRHCVNPDHLEPVDHTENLRRGMSPQAINGRKTHCIYGHEFTTQNTYIHPTRGRRHCRECAKRR